MKAAVLALALMTGCATTWTATTRRCPTTHMLAADFLLGLGMLGVSTLKWNAGKHGESLAYTAGAGAVFLGANIAEVRSCKR